jgi:peptidoglycan hydrolase CwlO-like protein
MVKALKVFIVLLVLLSVTALILAISLFGKREILKGRTQKLENAVAELAASLSRGEEPFIRDLGVAVDRNRLMIYDNPENPADRMDSEINKVRTLAAERYRELGTTYADLKKTSDELAETREILAQTRQELADARDEIAQLNQTLSERNAEIARQRDQIDALDREKDALQIQVDDLNNQIAKLEDDIQDQKDKIVTLEQTITDLEAQLGGPGALRALPRGLHGRILVVNKDWNFVVLDIGSRAGLVPNAEMLVHRGDQLIGKVLVSGVTRDLAVADIRSEWLQDQIREGDFVAVQ